MSINNESTSVGTIRVGDTVIRTKKYRDYLGGNSIYKGIDSEGIVIEILHNGKVARVRWQVNLSGWVLGIGRLSTSKLVKVNKLSTYKII